MKRQPQISSRSGATELDGIRYLSSFERDSLNENDRETSPLFCQQIKKSAPRAGRLSSITHGSVHGLAHGFDVLNDGNGLPLGVPGVVGEPS